MAIIRLIAPDPPVPVYNPVGYSVASNSVSQANFKYVCDIYYAGGTSFVRKKLPANPDNGYAYFDVAGILRKYMTSDPPTALDVSFVDCAKSYIDYVVKFGEEYGPTSGVTVYPNQREDDNTAFIAAFDYLDWAADQSIALNVYLLGFGTRFLTSAPDAAELRASDYYWLYFLNGYDFTDSGGPNGVCAKIQIKTYNAVGTIIATHVVSDSFDVTKRVQSIGVGPLNLDSSGILDAGTASYTVQLLNSSNAVLSDLRTFKIVTVCTPVKKIYTLTFLNKLGGYDSINFYGQPNKITDSEKNFFKKRQGAWSGNIFNYTVNDRAKTQFQTLLQDKIHLISAWINDAQSEWLEELFSSPDVLISYDDFTLVPVNILNANYEWKNSSRDKLFSVEFDVEFSFKRIRQQF